MKTALLVVVVVLIAGAFVLGYWPQRQRIAAMDAELVSLRQRADVAEARVRMGTLLGELRNVEEAVMRQNYGDAQQMALAFFDHVRADAATTGDGAIRQALERVAQRRDAVTAALARADGNVLGILRETEVALRQSLGYPLYGSVAPGRAPVAPVPPAGSPSAFPSASPAAPLGMPSP